MFSYMEEASMPEVDAQKENDDFAGAQEANAGSDAADRPGDEDADAEFDDDYEAGE